VTINDKTYKLTFNFDNRKLLKI